MNYNFFLCLNKPNIKIPNEIPNTAAIIGPFKFDILRNSIAIIKMINPREMYLFLNNIMIASFYIFKDNSKGNKKRNSSKQTINSFPN